jgi:hypothetical protein
MPPKKRSTTRKPKTDNNNKKKRKKRSTSSDEDFDSDSGAKNQTNNVFNDNNHNNNSEQQLDDDNDSTADEALMPSLPQLSGRLLVCGGTNWDLIGRKELPKSAKNSAQTASGLSINSFILFIFNFIIISLFLL